MNFRIFKINLRTLLWEISSAINPILLEQKRILELNKIMPATIMSDFKEAYIYVAGLAKSDKIKVNQNEVNFTSFIPAGKYDMEAQLIAKNNVVHPAYCVYIEKL